MRAQLRTCLTAATLALACSTLGACSDDTSDELSHPDLPETLGGPARGISIVSVEANQGVGVTLLEGESYIGPDERNAYLVRNRDTLVRFQHVIDDPDRWIPRELTGILHIVPPGEDADELLRVRTIYVEEDSDPRKLGENFFFSLLADEAVPGTRFWLELRESDSAIDVSSLAEGVPSVPSEPREIGFEPTDLDLEVVIVPVDYQWVDPPRYPDITDDDLKIFYDELLQQNPVQDIKISIRDEPLVWDEQLSNLGSLLSPTRALKEADEAPPNVYYHALVDVGGSSVNMVAGIAWLTDDSMDQAPRRTAATVYYKRVVEGDPETDEPDTVYPPISSARTWVHEIGHNQGLSHVYCPGADSANPDPDYPHENGKIGGFGFGIRSYHMHTPTASHDYMTYCGNSWVSDWTWNKTYERIQTLTSWNSAALVPPERVPTLVGTLFADGSEDWWLFEGPAPSPEALSSTERLEFWVEGERHVALAEVSTLSDGETRVLTVPMPAALEPEVETRGLGGVVDGLSRLDSEGERHPVELAAVHEQAFVAARQRAKVRAAH